MPGRNFTFTAASLLVLVTALASSSVARADDSPEEDVKSTVEYQAVDASTLRVFAIGTVGLETFRSDEGGKRIQVAIPEAGHGTGFMVGDDGLLLTAEHVIHGARHVVVRLPGKDGFTAARVIYKSKKNDIAVLSIETPIAAIELGDDTTRLKVRQTVFAIGYPMDPSRKQAQSARGIVAGDLENGTVQLDIAVNPGNSGGPLVDENNRVVGMVVARGDVEQGVQGMGFAVPLAKLTTALARARKKISTEGIPKLSAREKRSAKVVDELIQRGALHVFADRDDLNSKVSQRQLFEDLKDFTKTIEDPDLLAFVAGNLWNAHLVTTYGEVTEIGGNKLSVRARERLADDLRKRALKLAYRANKTDNSITKRSEYVRYAMRFFRDEGPREFNTKSTSRRSNSRYAARPGKRKKRKSTAKLLGPAENQVGARLAISLRSNIDSDTVAYGAAASGFYRYGWLSAKDGKAQTFLHAGAVAARASLDDGDQSPILHAFYGAELGLVHRAWQSGGAHLQLGLFWVPTYYRSNVTLEFSDTEVSASEFSLAQLRTSLGVAIGAAEITIGMRIFGLGIIWFEPLNVGFSF